MSIFKVWCHLRICSASLLLKFQSLSGTSGQLFIFLVNVTIFFCLLDFWGRKTRLDSLYKKTVRMGVEVIGRRMTQVFLSCSQSMPIYSFLGISGNMESLLELRRIVPTTIRTCSCFFPSFSFLSFSFMIFPARMIKQYSPFCFCFPETQQNVWFVDCIPSCSQCYYGFISITIAFG